MAREVLSNGVINPDKYQADWYADLSNNWNLLNNLIGSAISSSEVDSKIATAIQELMIRTFQIVAELPVTGTEGVMYLVLIPDTSKYTAYVWENNAYRELGVIQMTITIDDELSTTSENPVQNKVITNALGGKASSSHTHTASDITSGLATVATSGSYNDLSNKPTIPTVNNATLTIQKNGTTLNTFTANASSDVTCNITVPTKTSDLTNDSNFITEDTTKIPLSGTSALSGDLVPASNGTINLGDTSHFFNYGYFNSLSKKENGLRVVYNNIRVMNISRYDTPTSNLYAQYILYKDKDGEDLVNFQYGYETNLTSRFQLKVSSLVSGKSDLTINYRVYADGSKSIAPQTDNDVNLGNSSYNYKRVYTKEVRHGLNSGSLVCSGGDGTTNGAYLALYGTNRTDGFQGRFDLSTKGSSDYKLTGLPSGTLTWGSKNVAMQEDVVPRSGGQVMTGSVLGRNVNDSSLAMCGGTRYDTGGAVSMFGGDYSSYGLAGAIKIAVKSSSEKIMYLKPDGTWTWSGTACQITSDQRLKQQIAEIDDKLLDAWEDVEPCQFKYNEAVETKGNQARLHTGYVVQQIDEACKKHNVDVSKYGLYCHEEYPEETEEVEVEQKDGTKVKERKVIREASGHYSLRYTEALIVECAFLRKCIKELRNEIEELKSSK